MSKTKKQEAPPQAFAAFKRIGASFVGQVHVGTAVLWQGQRRSSPLVAKDDAKAALPEIQAAQDAEFAAHAAELAALEEAQSCAT